jgi:hypothetical protein
MKQLIRRARRSLTSVFAFISAGLLAITPVLAPATARAQDAPPILVPLDQAPITGTTEVVVVNPEPLPAADCYFCIPPDFTPPSTTRYEFFDKQLYSMGPDSTGGSLASRSRPLPRRLQPTAFPRRTGTRC